MWAEGAANGALPHQEGLVCPRRLDPPPQWRRGRGGRVHPPCFTTGVLRPHLPPLHRQQLAEGTRQWGDLDGPPPAMASHDAQSGDGWRAGQREVSAPLGGRHRSSLWLGRLSLRAGEGSEGVGGGDAASGCKGTESLRCDQWVAGEKSTPPHFSLAPPHHLLGPFYTTSHQLAPPHPHHPTPLDYTP